MANILIYRPPSTLVATVSVDEKTVLSKKLMNEHKITSEFYSKTILNIQLGDYISYGTENFYINRLPDIVKLNNSTFKYNIIFESVLYDLYRKLFISSDGLADFSYSGEAVDFLTNIVTSINEISSGWMVGTVDATEELLLQFTNESCRTALTRIAEAFKLEFELVGKVINMISTVGNLTDYSFQYGRGLGLYKLTRQQVSDQNIITRVYGFGGTKNIPFGYRTRAKRLVFETGTPAVRYLEKNVSLYGTIEGQFTDDNIYPAISGTDGTLTGVNYAHDADWNPKTDYVINTNLSFDINDYLIDGVIATIVFKTGDLAGQEFEIWKYVHATGRIYFNPFSDTDGYTTPNEFNYPVPGDTFALINISLPQPYIDTAEIALETATQAFLDQNSIPQVVYSLDIDPHYAKINSIILDVGDKVTIVDADLGINNLIRVSGLEFPLVNPFKIKTIISDFVPYTVQERIIKSAISTRKETVFVDRRNAELARRNTMRQNQLKTLLFDPDGYFDPINIKPISVETLNLIVGTKSINLRLSGVTIEPNHGGDANEIVISAGDLIHYQIDVGGVYTWVMSPAATFSTLNPASAYYLYAKCHKAASTGEWDLSTDKKLADPDDGHYYFLCGVLYAVLDGYRDWDYMYGITYINGSTVTTGILKSVNGLNYFNLDTGELKAVGVTEFGTSTAVVGGLSQNLAILGPDIWENAYDGDSSAILVNRMGYNKGTTHYRNFNVYDGKGTNILQVIGEDQRVLIQGGLQVTEIALLDGPLTVSDVIDMQSTTKALILSRLTNAVMVGLSGEGMIAFNTDDKHFYGHNGTIWKLLDNV